MPGRGWAFALAGVFAIAFAWRLAYFGRLGASVLGGSLVSDSEIYWIWASWLREHGWWGLHPFYMGPLYPYSLAAVRAVTADSIPAALAVQGLFGAAACALLADAARRLAGPAIGVAIGLWAAFYETAVFMDGLVLMESQLFVLETALLWVIVAGAYEGRRPLLRLAGLGVLLGLIAAARASSALLLPVALAFVAFPGGAAPAAATRGRTAARLAAVLAGFALVAAPIAARNRAIGGEWIPFSYNGGLNLYIGNNPEANGTFMLVTGTQVVASGVEPEGVGIDGREYIRLTTGRALTPAQSSAWWSAKAVAWMRAEPAKAAELALRRVAMMWNAAEYAQVESLDEFRAVAGPLGLPGAGTFAALGPFALLGLGLVLLARRGGRGGAFAAAYAVTLTLAIAPFFVTDRYRHHLVPAAFLLAAIALGEIVAWARARPRVAADGARLVALAIVALVIVHLPVPRLSDEKRAWGVASDLGARYLQRGDVARALAQFDRALELERKGGAPAGAGGTLALERASLYNNYAVALERAGRTDEARAWFDRALALAPDNAQVLQGRAALEARQGDAARAESLYARMSGTVRGAGAGALGRGLLAARAGRLAEARDQFAAAVAAEPGLHAAWGALVRAELQLGRVEAADSALQRARAAGWTDDGEVLHEALLAAARGDRAKAAALRARVSDAFIAADPTLAESDRVLARFLGR